MRLTLTFAGVFVVTALISPLPHDRRLPDVVYAVRGERAEAAEVSAFAPPAPFRDNGENLSAPPVLAFLAGDGKAAPLPPARAPVAGPKSRHAAAPVAPELDLAALGLIDPRTPPGGQPKSPPNASAPRPTGPVMTATELSFLKARLDAQAVDPSSHPYPVPAVVSDLDLAALGLTDPRTPPAGAPKSQPSDPRASK